VDCILSPLCGLGLMSFDIFLGGIAWEFALRDFHSAVVTLVTAFLMRQDAHFSGVSNGSRGAAEECSPRR